MSHAQKPSGLAAGNQQKTGLKNWLAKRPSAFTFMLIVLVSLVVGSINPNFWQLATLFDMVRSSVVLGLFALGVLFVLAAGGLDVAGLSRHLPRRDARHGWRRRHRPVRRIWLRLAARRRDEWRRAVSLGRARGAVRAPGPAGAAR